MIRESLETFTHYIISPLKLHDKNFFRLLSQSVAVRLALYLFLLISFGLFGKSLHAQAKPDLKFQAEPVLANEFAVTDGGWAHFRAVVVNAGEAVATNVHVDLYKNFPGGPPTGLDGEMTHIIRLIEPGQEIKIDYLYRSVSGTYDVFFVIDPRNNIEETNETNNISAGVGMSVDGPLAEDNWEVRSDGAENDDIDHSRYINVPFFSNTMVSKDNDFYRITASQGQYLRFKVRHDAYVAPLDIYLYDPDKAEIASSTNHNDDEEIALRITRSGTYYLEVRKVSGDTQANESQYEMDVKLRRMSDLRVTIEEITSTLLTDEDKDLIAHLNLEGSNVTEDTPRYRVKVRVKAQDVTASTGLSWRDNCDSDSYGFINCIVPSDVVYPPSFEIDFFVNRKSKPSVGEIGDQAPYTANNVMIGSEDDFETHEYVDANGDNDPEKPYRNHDDDYWQFTRNNYMYHTFEVVVGPGDYTFSAIVDTGNWHPEISETNNVSGLGYYRIAGDTTTDSFEDTDDEFPGALLTSGDYLSQSSWDGMEYYHVYLPPGKRLQFTVDYILAGSDLDLYMFDGDQNLTAFSDSGTNRETISVYNPGPDTVVHYFRVGEAPSCPASGNSCTYFTTTSYDVKVAITNEFDHDAAINSVSLDPLLPSYGDTLFVKTQVENRGAFPLENVELELFLLGENATAPDEYDTAVGQSVIDLLMPGEKRQIDLTLPVSDGKYRLYALIDRHNTLAESDKDNNLYGPLSLSIDLPRDQSADDELEPSSETYIDEEGKEITTNDVWQTAVPIEAKSYSNLAAVDEDWYTYELLPKKWFSALANFTSTVGDIDLLVARTIMVDKYDSNGDKLPEQVERLVVLRYAGNLGDSEVIQYFNDSSEPLKVYLAVIPLSEAFDNYSLKVETLDGNANGLADLVIDSYVTVPSPSSPSTTIYGGDIITTTVAVKNIGSWITTNSTSVELYYSSAPRTGDFGDMFEVIEAGMAPGEVRYFTFEYSLEGGSYPLHLAVDPGNRVNESNEQNNEAHADYNIVVQGGSSGNIKATNLTSEIDSVDKKVSADFSIANTTYNTDFYLKFELRGGPDNRIVYEWDPIWYQSLFNAGISSVTLPFDRHVPGGDLRLRMIVDWGNRVGEDNESDNAFDSGYIFHSNPGAIYSIHTYGNSSIDTVLEIYRYDGASGDLGANLDETKLTLVRRIDDRNGLFAADTLNLSTGLYFARVYSFGSSTASLGDYFIAYGGGYANWSVDDTIAIDETEGDDTPQTAQPLSLSPLRKTISVWHDEDWFYFQMESVWVEFSPGLPANILSQLEVKLYRDTGDASDSPDQVTMDRLVESGTFVGYKNSFYISGQFLPGRYFVSVSGPAEAGDYSVIRNRPGGMVLTGPGLHDPNVVYQNDQYEPNDVPAEATPAELGVEKTSNLLGSGLDWYTFGAGY